MFPLKPLNAASDACELVRLTEFLDRSHIGYCLIAGTLLGCIRHGDLMSWDDDIDLLIPKRQLQRVPEALSGEYEIEPYRNQFRVWRNHLLFDLWPWEPTPDGNRILTEVGLFPMKKFMPFRSGPLSSFRFPVPQDPFHFLDHNYPRWRTHIVTPDGVQNFSGLILTLADL